MSEHDLKDQHEANRSFCVVHTRRKTLQELKQSQMFQGASRNNPNKVLLWGVFVFVCFLLETRA